jgi:hypothetical protein
MTDGPSQPCLSIPHPILKPSSRAHETQPFDDRLSFATTSRPTLLGHQKRAGKSSCRRCLKARETASMPLVQRTPIALEVGLPRLTQQSQNILYAGAELSRLCPVYIGSTNNHGAERENEACDVSEVKH